MRKRIIGIVIILTAAIILVACGSSKPKGMTQKTYDNGCRALEIMEKYNDMEISAEDAETRLEGIMDSLEDEYPTLLDVLESSSNLLVKLDISFFVTALHGTAGSTYDQEDALREKLGK